MATLVFSTVGTMLGGPIGGAIGSLIGQSIDQQLFGGGPRRGPRLGDLSVQTSTYGTPIPRIYGTMRVAGSVIWATDLKESEQLQGGAKGQPGTIVYSYSVSFAVALSSRPARQIKRIWADGKLLRGAAGDFKVKTGFRFYSGAEDQEIDPLIGSIEGIGSTPAYRGLAIAVFEDLELAEFGNRIPFLTFEIEADANAPTLGTLLGDASGGSIACTSMEPVPGYAAHGGSIRSAVEPLVEHFGLDLFDDGSVLRSPAAGAASAVSEDHLGATAALEGGPRIERTQVPARALPATLTLNYYDPDRDYQAGQMRASVEGRGGPHQSVEIPMAMDAGAAKGLAESSLARRWIQRDRLTLRLAPTHCAIEPGAQLLVPGMANIWVAEQVMLEAMAAQVQLRPLGSGAPAVPADPGRPISSPDVVVSPTSLALLDLPDLGLFRTDAPVVHLAACSSSAGWRPVPIEVLAGGELRATQSAFGEAVMGTVVTVLPPSQSVLFDCLNSIEVILVDPAHWLESRDDTALAQGANLAAVGSELVQFGSATPLGGNRFRLERLLRGRRGTEWAMQGHSAGEAFVLLDANSLRAIELAREALGSEIEARALGIADGAGTLATITTQGEAMRPPSPVHLQADFTGAGDLMASWVRRSRSGWAWVDEMDAPLGEAAERYRVRVESLAGRIEAETSVPSITFAAEDLAALGSGQATLSVMQIGDHALSRSAAIGLMLE